MRLLTHSRLASFRDCQRKHWFAYVMGKRAIHVPEALRFGTMIHRALEYYWTSRKMGWTETDRNTVLFYPDTWTEFDAFTKEKARVMLACYMARWDLMPCEVLDVEAQFTASLYDPETGEVSDSWQLGGKIDAILRIDEKIVPVEHKTTADEVEEGGSYRNRRRVDGQISQYFRGMRALGYTVDHLLYDVLKKPKQRPLLATPLEHRKYKKDGALYESQRDRDELSEEYSQRIFEITSKSPEQYIVQFEVTRTKEEERAYAFDVWQFAKQIEESEQTGIAPRNTDHCWKYDEPCEFLGVCERTCSIDDPLKYRTKKVINEELTE